MLNSGTQTLLDQFARYLEGVFTSNDLLIQIGDVRLKEASGYDVALNCSLDNESWTFLVEIKMSPITARNFPRRPHNMPPNVAAVVLAPFISKSIQQNLAAGGINYWDVTGNALINVRAPRIYLRTTGASKNPAPQERKETLNSLKGRAAGRVVLSLFTTPRPASLRELSRLAETGLGTVSRVVDLLKREGILTEDVAGRPRLLSRQALMNRWIEDYNFVRSNKVRRYVATYGNEQTLRRLASSKFQYAITGIAAQSRLITNESTSVFPSEETWAYIANADAVADELGLIAVLRGGDFLVADDSETGGLNHSIRIGNLVLAEQWRVVADLLSSPGRERAAGQQLFDQLLGSINDRTEPANW